MSGNDFKTDDFIDAEIGPINSDEGLIPQASDDHQAHEDNQEDHQAHEDNQEDHQAHEDHQEDQEHSSEESSDEPDAEFIKGLRENISRNSLEIADLKLFNDEREKNKGKGKSVSGQSTPRSQNPSDKIHPKYVYASAFENPQDKFDRDGWSDLKRYRFQKFLWKLKYNRIVSSFYLDNLIESEQRMSWMIVVISTLTSGLTVANNVDGGETGIKNYNTYINILLTVSSMSTSLIAAWIKKQMFIEKINSIDKFLVELNSLCEDMELQLSLLNTDRLQYDDFKTKYVPLMTQYLTTNPIIPPDEWKKCIREITVDYPELLNIDDSEDNKMWPWYGDYIYDITDDNKDDDNIPQARYPTTFYSEFKKTHKDKLRSSCCGGGPKVSMY